MEVVEDRAQAVGGEVTVHHREGEVARFQGASPTTGGSRIVTWPGKLAGQVSR